MNIESFNALAASPREYAEYNALMNEIRRERFPEDPPLTVEDETRMLQSRPAFLDAQQWSVWEDEHMIGAGTAQVARENFNQHLEYGMIDILAAHRRRGIGRQLLARIADAAVTENRRQILFECYSTAPAGEAFMRRIGGTLGLVEKMSSLDVAAVDRALLRRWVEAGDRLAPEFELVMREDLADGPDLARVVDVWNVMNTAPRENLELEDEQHSEERVRDIARYIKARGGTHWGCYVRHAPSGAFAAFSETAWYPSHATIIEQWATGVRPEFRGRGLGRWIKAAMLERVLRERPAVRFVRTENAGSNEPMLRINLELGFRPYVTRFFWKVETRDALDYVRGSGESGS
jgi:GNAT superfamily N-acetyltransferase